MAHLVGLPRHVARIAPAWALDGAFPLLDLLLLLLDDRLGNGLAEALIGCDNNTAPLWVGDPALKIRSLRRGHHLWLGLCLVSAGRESGRGMDFARLAR